VKIHYWIVSALVAVDNRVGVQTNNEKITLCPRLLQKVQVANVEEVECTSHIHNPIPWLKYLLNKFSISWL
jgi:hypothetical protein